VLPGRALGFVAGGESGPPVLLLHGFGADRMSWALQQAGLARFASTIAVDLPGHGESANDVGDGSIAAVGDMVAGLIGSRMAEPAHLIGHSLGGALAIDLAHRFPDRVASLFLVAPAGLGAIDRNFLADFLAIADLAEAQRVLERLVARPRLVNRQMAARMLDRLDQPGTRQALGKIAEGLVNAGNGLAPAIVAIGQSDLPRTVVWGEDDGINQIDQARVTAFAKDLTLLPATGHMPQVEDPARVDTLLRGFYRKLGLG